MNGKVILNDKVIYDKCAAELSCVDDIYNRVTLTTPANDCLSIILKNRPDVTTQRELFEEVWEKHGIPINANTFYQNISVIRKAFRTLGVEYNVVITIPRRGVAIADAVKIVDFKNTETLELTSVDNTKLHLEDVDANEELLTPADIKKERGLLGTMILKLIAVVIIVPMAIFISSGIFSVYSKIKSNMYGFKYIYNYKGCNIYNNGKNTGTYTEIEKNAIDVIGVSCLSNERIYFSTYPGFPDESLIHCDGDILKSGTVCRSKYSYVLESSYEK